MDTNDFVFVLGQDDPTEAGMSQALFEEVVPAVVDFVKGHRGEGVCPSQLRRWASVNGYEIMDEDDGDLVVVKNPAEEGATTMGLGEVLEMLAGGPPIDAFRVGPCPVHDDVVHLDWGIRFDGFEIEFVPVLHGEWIYRNLGEMDITTAPPYACIMSRKQCLSGRIVRLENHPTITWCFASEANEIMAAHVAAAAAESHQVVMGKGLTVRLLALAGLDVEQLQISWGEAANVLGQLAGNDD